MANEQPLPAYKLKILTVLAEYKYLTSKQIWDKTGAAMEGRSYKQTRVELDRLKKAGLVRVEQVRGESGQTGQHQWMLRQAGARLINFNKFGKHYRRELTRYQADYHKLELDLEEQIDLALGDWKLVKRQTGRLPEETEQYTYLCKVLTWQEFLITGRRPGDDFGPHTIMVPLKANHHVAFLPDYKKAVVLILARPRATHRFWQERSKQYGRLAKKIPVYGVFPNKEQLLISAGLLAGLGLKSLSVGQVSGLLSSLYH